MLCTCKGDNMFEKVIVRKSKPLFGNINIDGSPAIMTAFVPCFIKLGFIGSILLLEMLNYYYLCRVF